MNTELDASRGRRAFLLTGAAFLWSVFLVIAALVLPVYGGTESTTASGGVGSMPAPSSTLVGVNGTGVLLVVGLPALLTVFVWLALRDRFTHGRRASGYIAWTLIGLLAAGCLVAVLSIGVFVLPVTLLLASAASLTPSGGPA